jgi:hypothetical protein
MTTILQNKKEREKFISDLADEIIKKAKAKETENLESLTYLG